MTRREFVGAAAASAAGGAFAAIRVPVGGATPKRLMGFLMAPWSGDYDEKDFMKTNLAGIDHLAAAL